MRLKTDPQVVSEAVSSMAGSSSWLSRPVGGVTSGTVQAGVAGCFRAPGCVEVVLNKHSELQLVAVSPGGKLEPVFSQPLFSSVRSMSALRFTQVGLLLSRTECTGQQIVLLSTTHDASSASPMHACTRTALLANPQVLDHVLLLLDSGSLMVLKYSQVVQRFYIAAEAQLAAGGALWALFNAPMLKDTHGSFFTSTDNINSVAMCLLLALIHATCVCCARVRCTRLACGAPTDHHPPSPCTVLCCAVLCAGTSADPDYLGARLAVSPQPTAAGDALTVAVAAKRGRIACLTVQLAADGSVQLSSPVVYALPAPRVLGASYTLMKRDMDLGDVIDLVLLPRSNQHGQQQQQQQGQAVEHLAVLSHRCEGVSQSSVCVLTHVVKCGRPQFEEGCVCAPWGPQALLGLGSFRSACSAHTGTVPPFVDTWGESLLHALLL